MREGLERKQQGGDADAFALPDFTSIVHELKSPLASIRQLALAINDADLSPAELHEYAQRIELTSERALRLASDLTRAERLEDALFACEPVNTLAICDDVISEMRSLYVARGRRIELARRRPTPLVVANRELLRRILINFSDNALHYAPESGVVRLGVSTTRSGEVIRVGVRDYGPGISSDIWRRLTGGKQPTISRRPNSSGLGLYLSKQFAEAMGARMGVIRHQDGASFYVELMGSAQTSLL